MSTYPINEFHNFAYFIFPAKITQYDTFSGYITAHSEDWQLVPEGIKTDYILNYACSMNEPKDDRMTTYTFRDPGKLPLYLMEQAEIPKDDPFPEKSGFSPRLEAIRLYVFAQSIAFLEFHLLYDGMSLPEIERFNYWFRNLRNDESKSYLHFPEGKDSVKTTLAKLLPNEQSGTELCFSNRSDVKQQALVYTAVHNAPKERKDRQRTLFLLSHGQRPNFTGALNKKSKYERTENFGPKNLWAGCQDGLACVNTEETPYSYQYDHLCCDYHFMYLLLLNQRYAIISYLDYFRQKNDSSDDEQKKYNEIVTLKTSYSFRTVSDDSYMQAVYSDMYEVLEIDNMIKDLDDANEKVNKRIQEENRKIQEESRRIQEDQQQHEQRFERILSALSILAISSALIDLTDYIERIREGSSRVPLISLGLNVIIIIAAIIWILRKK